jgi:hypothetical protein
MHGNGINATINMESMNKFHMKEEMENEYNDSGIRKQKKL